MEWGTGWGAFVVNGGAYPNEREIKRKERESKSKRKRELSRGGNVNFCLPC